jgi:hypothetical protein
MSANRVGERRLQGGVLLAASLGFLGLLSSCGGAGGGGAKVKIGFQGGSALVDEGLVGAVTLVLTTPAPLAEDASVTVSDAAVGTAADGADYTFGPAQTVTFPAGSADGATQTVDVTALADTLVEAAEETLRLALSGPSAGVGLAKYKTCTVAVRDQNAAAVQFSEAAAATPDEADATVDATVELELAPGDTLAVQVAVSVADTGTGSATSGSDYAPFATTVLSFAPGAADGAAFTVQVTIQDDGAIEPDETIVLALGAPVSAADVDLGPSAQHVLSITEDDGSSAPFLHVTSAGGGPESPVPSGSTLDLGSQPSGAGPTTGVTVTLYDLGVDALHLSQVNLAGDFGDFALELIDGAAAPSPPAEMPAPAPFPFAALGQDPLQGVELRYDAARAAALAGHERVTLFGVRLPDELADVGGGAALELERVEPPFAPDAVLLVDGRPHALAEALGDLSLWRGTLAGDPASRAFLALSSQGSSGWIQRGDGRSYELVSEAAGGAGAPRSRLVSTAALAEQSGGPAFECAEMAPFGGAPATAGLVPGELPEKLTMGLSLAECRLALETDYQLYQKFGSVPAATAYVTQLVAAISGQYEEDVQTTLSIAYLGLYSSAADPWTTPDGPGSTANMLDEFQTAWNASGWPVAADLAHFLSGASLGGGIAYVGVLCNPFYGYGVSGNITGTIVWSGWTGQPSGSSWDFTVVAHELGHNFGASHTHSYCPPLDHCYANCDGTTACTQGTIMSYCHVCGGMGNLRLEFHPHVANAMRTAVAASCLGGTTLDGGANAAFQVRFEPHTGPGAKSATLSFTHDAPNAVSPFTIVVDGSAL